ncbi:MAG: flagellar motor switch protein FliN [Planctomycetota bacterium]|jgi:flagellar motor switch protein FliN/FliY
MPDELSQDDIDALLTGGGGGELSGTDLDALLDSAEGMSLPDFDESSSAAAAAPGDGGAASNSIELLYDVELTVRVELGRCKMSVEDILKLKEGSVVTFDKEAGAQVDILVNDKLVAHGEVLVLNDLFCVRVTDILSNKDRAILKDFM